MTVMKRNVFLLALCQAALFTGTSLMMTASALVGKQLAGTAAIATIPLGLQFVAMVCTTFPASLLMKNIGRRNGFMLGSIIGLIGAGAAAYAIVMQSFLLFCGASFLLGISNSFGQFYRFAAADVATEDYRSRAISYVLAGGVIAAFIGPNLAAFTRAGFEIPFVASYCALAGVMLLGLTLCSMLTIPTPSEQERSGTTRSLLTIARQPTFIVAVLGALIGYGVMNLVMTATPLAMDAYKHSFPSTAFVIQWHIVAMFLPSFFTGHLIKRFGVLTIMLCGTVLLAACVAVHFSGTTLFHFTVGLILVGLGWNFLYIGATNLITETYTPAEKAKTQALNDFFVFTTVAITAFSSGAVQHRFGWNVVNGGVIPLIIIVLVAITWLMLRRRREAVIA